VTELRAPYEPRKEETLDRFLAGEAKDLPNNVRIGEPTVLASVALPELASFSLTAYERDLSRVFHCP
jgi:hypothetical protein